MVTNTSEKLSASESRKQVTAKLFFRGPRNSQKGPSERGTVPAAGHGGAGREHGGACRRARREPPPGTAESRPPSLSKQQPPHSWARPAPSCGRGLPPAAGEACRPAAARDCPPARAGPDAPRGRPAAPRAAARLPPTRAGEACSPQRGRAQAARAKKKRARPAAARTGPVRPPRAEACRPAQRACRRSGGPGHPTPLGGTCRTQLGATTCRPGPRQGLAAPPTGAADCRAVPGGTPRPSLAGLPPHTNRAAADRLWTENWPYK
ncbi:translation initiation factor IF-2-like [Jatropha curcas]|uniref:translation initiation factor IF-2-like n=1 Tax=Jatropha curcas TaxID=180498 RepID=UPI001894F743|nr:translation initiation factor IF-2-like [Jatropha curcas]